LAVFWYFRAPLRCIGGRLFESPGGICGRRSQ
jgi:hypothetical protein